MTEFSDFVEKVSTIITDIFNEKGEMPPTWLFTSDGLKLYVEVTPFGDINEKNLVDTTMRGIFTTLKIKRYVYVSEAWAVKGHRKDQDKLLKGPPPSERPDREEVIILSGQDISGDNVFAIAPIHRNVLSKLAMIKEFKLDYSNKTSLQGRFVNMFGEREEINENNPGVQ